MQDLSHAPQGVASTWQQSRCISRTHCEPPFKLLFLLFFDACAIKRNLYEIAEKHLVLTETPRRQVDAWVAIEADVRRSHPIEHTNLLLLCSFYRHIPTFLMAKTARFESNSLRD
jgi:hypothetical protein